MEKHGLAYVMKANLMCLIFIMTNKIKLDQRAQCKLDFYKLFCYVNLKDKYYKRNTRFSPSRNDGSAIREMLNTEKEVTQ